MWNENKNSKRLNDLNELGMNNWDGTCFRNQKSGMPQDSMTISIFLDDKKLWSRTIERWFALLALDKIGKCFLDTMIRGKIDFWIEWYLERMIFG